MNRQCFIIPVCVLAVLSATGCQTSLPVSIGSVTGTKLSDEEKIAIVLDDVQRGMENRRIYQVLAHVSHNYKDLQERNYDMLREDLNTLLKNYRDIKITRTPPRIRVEGNRARVVDTFGAIADSVSPNEYPPVNLQGQVVIMMERFADTWQIVEWGPVG